MLYHLGCSEEFITSGAQESAHGFLKMQGFSLVEFGGTTGLKKKRKKLAKAKSHFESDAAKSTKKKRKTHNKQRKAKKATSDQPGTSEVEKGPGKKRKRHGNEEN